MNKSTITSIAKTTGFSVSTVSRVLSGKADTSRISPKTVAIIKAEADRSNYTPSLLARSLRTNTTNTIGLIVPSIDNPFFANIASIIIKEAKEKGYTIILADTSEDENNENECITSLTSRHIDGLIIIPCGKNVERLEKINLQDIPVVLIDRYSPDTVLSYVSTDNYQGAIEAVEYLIKNGHKNIACIQGKIDTTPVIERIRGYRDCMTEHELANHITIVGDEFSVQNGYNETSLLLEKADKPTAIFALSNTIALGVYKALKEKRIKVPNEMSVICFDNHLYLDYVEPVITRIAQPVDQIAVLAMQTLFESIKKKGEKEKVIARQILLPTSLILGESVMNISQ